MRFDAKMDLSVNEITTGQRVGPYTLLFRLSKGGMGEVWCASAGSSTGGMGDFLKLVALKLLRDAEEGSNSSVMFFDEARTAAALQHASIVPTLDLGQAQSTYYLAMEMIRGPSLTALLQHLALKKIVTPPAIVAYIGERIASALDYANARAEIQGKKLHLVHRDISPHNVLLDQSGNVVLSDFGVARTAVQDHLSRVGTVRGKPSYMAPEQVNGGEIDGRTDVFALGTVLYETACVKRLFGRGKPMQSMQAVLTHEPQPLTEKVAGFPKELADVIHRALQKKPEDRYQSASEMVQALAECSRKLPGSSTVQRDLADLIGELFPGGSFDVEGKAREAISSLGEMTQSGVHEAGGTNGAAVRPSAMQEGDLAVPTALSGRHVPVVWPTSSHADPLADEALAEVQQQQTQMGYFQSGGNFTPIANPGVSTVDGYNPLPVPQSGPRTMTWVLASVAVVGIVGLAAGAWVVAKSPARPAQLEARTAPNLQEEAPPRSLGVVQGTEPKAPTVAAAGTKPPEPEPEPTNPGPNTNQGRRPERTKTKATNQPESAPPTPPPVEKPAPQPAKKKFAFADDKEGILACARALEGREQKALATRVKMGLSAAGGNAEALRNLRDMCVSALNEAD